MKHFSCYMGRFLTKTYISSFLLQSFFSCSICFTSSAVKCWNISWKPSCVTIKFIGTTIWNEVKCTSQIDVKKWLSFYLQFFCIYLHHMTGTRLAMRKKQCDSLETVSVTGVNKTHFNFLACRVATFSLEFSLLLVLFFDILEDSVDYFSLLQVCMASVDNWRGCLHPRVLLRVDTCTLRPWATMGLLLFLFFLLLIRAVFPTALGIDIPIL